MTWYTCGTPAVHLRLRYYPYNFLLALLSPASDSLSSLDSKLRHSAYAHLRVARAQCVYGLFSLGFVGVWWWWWVWHLPLSYHPPVIFTLHLKFIFHIKLVGPVDVRSLNTPSGAVILTRPFLSEFRLIKRCTCTYIMTWYTCGTRGTPAVAVLSLQLSIGTPFTRF